MREHARAQTHQQTPPPVPTTLCPQVRTLGPVRAPRRRQTPPRTLPPPPLPPRSISKFGTLSNAENTPSKAGKNLDPGHPFLETLDADASSRKFRSFDSWWICP
jgi:hypothetical protein